ncbi:CheY-like chemotaxis protein [Bradyrhizobium sp. LB7.2]|uniref:response regulator n=1 Tax=Bradyrhizobium sp. LB14.3 TaxID=3156328 RepID=UPI0033953A40
MNTELLVIMVVEDDPLIQTIVEESLAEGGFHPEVASSGEGALTLLQNEESKYLALITDVNLSGALTGWDVARRARELNPHIPVVYMTGAAADDWPSLGVPQSMLLQKPFAPAQVVTAISQLLNQVPPTHE